MASRPEIIHEIEGLEVHCRAPLMTVDARSRWLADWAHDLEKFPYEAIRDAVADWRKSGNAKFPTPGQIIPMIQAKTRKDSDPKRAAQKWSDLSQQEYEALSLDEKIRHQRILSERAKFNAGPMYRAGMKWGSGNHMTPDEMPPKWHELQHQADGHSREAKRLKEFTRRQAMAAE